MSQKSIAKSAGVIGVATTCSRVLGFFRDILIAKLFGTAIFAQAFVVAFRIPNLLRDIVGEGATNAAFVPVLTEVKAKEGEAEFWKLAWVIMNFMFVALMALALIGVFLAPVIVKVIAPGFLKDPEKLAMTVKLTRIMFPYIMLIGLTALCMGVLNSLKHFAAPAFGPCLLNLSMITACLFFAPRMKEPVVALAFGVLAGGFLQLGAQLPVLYRKGMRHSMEKLEFIHPAGRKIRKLLLPRALGTCVYQLSIFVATILASLTWIVGEGGVAALYYANRIIQFPMAIFGISMATAALPTMSQHAAEGDMDKLRQTLSFSLRTVFLIMIPSAVGLLVLSQPIIRALFERGKFGAYSTDITSYALFFYAFGLFAYAGIKILVSCFYSMQDTFTPVKVASASLAINVVLSLILMWPLRVGGLALATSLSAAFNFVLLSSILSKRINGIDEKRILNSLFRILFAACLMGIACFFIKKFLIAALPSQAIFFRILHVGIPILVGIFVYIGGCRMFKVREMEEALKWIQDLRRR